MRIAVLTWGSRGDFQPYLALAAALQASGHEVRLGAPASKGFEELSSSHGVTFAPLGSGIDGGYVESIVRSIDVSTANPVALIRMTLDHMLKLPDWQEMYAACLELACWSDIVVSHFFQVTGSMVAEAADKPFISGTLVPTQLPTSRRAPGNRNWGSWMNRRSWNSAVDGMNTSWLPPINEARKAVNLPPLNDVAGRGFYSQALNLVATSPRIFSRPGDWPPQHLMTGCWLLGLPQEWTPPPRVSAFFEEGPPPVAIGFGSMASSDSDALRMTILDAIKRAGVRAVIEPGLARLHAEDADVLVDGEIPHAWLLPRVSAIVHHGGAGTAAAAFHAGTPAVIVPHLYDQHFWAQRAWELGVATKPLPASGLTSQLLARAIRTVSEDAQIKKRAQKLETDLGHDGDGAARAVTAIEKYAESAMPVARS